KSPVDCDSWAEGVFRTTRKCSAVGEPGDVAPVVDARAEVDEPAAEPDGVARKHTERSLPPARVDKPFRAVAANVARFSTGGERVLTAKAAPPLKREADLLRGIALAIGQGLGISIER